MTIIINYTEGLCTRPCTCFHWPLHQLARGELRANLMEVLNHLPVPKRPTAKELNDFCPVALTSMVMKSMERLVLRRLLNQVQLSMDSDQFAYKARRCVDDASALMVGLHLVSEYLETPGSYARVRFVDFNSAFNTMRPSILISKLGALRVARPLCQWILSYFWNRPQQVRVKQSLSTIRYTNIGALQGCVLSPMLFTIYTNK